MSMMTDVQTVGANATVENILAGKVHEFLPERSSVMAYIAAAAAGLRATLLIGGETVLQDQEVSAADRFPIRPDDLVGRGAGFGGDRLILSLRNTTGSTIVVRSLVDVAPV